MGPTHRAGKGNAALVHRRFRCWEHVYVLIIRRANYKPTINRDLPFEIVATARISRKLFDFQRGKFIGINARVDNKVEQSRCTSGERTSFLLDGTKPRFCWCRRWANAKTCSWRSRYRYRVFRATVVPSEPSFSRKIEFGDSASVNLANSRREKE